MQVKSLIKVILFRGISLWFSLFHKIEKKILFESFNGVQYSDNPRSISERMHQMYPDYKIIWHLLNHRGNNNLEIPNYIHVVSSRTQFYKE